MKYLVAACICIKLVAHVILDVWFKELKVYQYWSELIIPFYYANFINLAS